MKTPKAPEETDEQKAERRRAEADNVRSIQDTVQQRTSLFRRRVSPNVSIATGKSSGTASIM